MTVQKVFRKTLFGVFSLFVLISISTSVLCIYTVDTHLTSEYVSNSIGIAKTIADASVEILLNRNLSSLQSLIDQFSEIQGIGYIYIIDEQGEFIAHTFVPGIPEEILLDDSVSDEVVQRQIPGFGDFAEVSSPILGGIAGTVHIGMSTGLIALKVQRAVGQQVYLISSIFIFGVLTAVWLINLAAKPLATLIDYAARLARERDSNVPDGNLLVRDDEIGELAFLFLYFSRIMDPRKAIGGPPSGPA